ncbi:MAG: DUF1460 domain-containing protein [Candidatus Dadabacteria bacterium]|nr:MAG: DUF1460 domain-containing protein [Candidatus Dadabacteria bacterium]
MNKKEPDTDRELKQLIAKAATAGDLQERILLVAKYFIGRPYLDSPLSRPEGPEELIFTLSGFDCVTFAETVLAIALSKTAPGVYDHLRRLRYSGGVISWEQRNHYMLDWIAENVKAGLLEEPFSAEATSKVAKKLSALSDYPEHQREINYIPLERFNNILPELKAGDIIFFGTTRPDLDVSHMGLLEPQNGLNLIHASKSKGEVIREDLNQFLVRFGESPGVLLARVKDRQLN